MSESTDGYYRPLVHVADAADEGRTLRDVLRGRLGVSRRLLIRLKASERGLMRNGEIARVWEKVAAGDRIELRMEAEASDDILPQPMALSIVYEDDHLLVLDKPPGLIVHPTTGRYTNTLANGVVHYWAERGERRRFRPVHRLDEHTSGLVVVAKHPYAHQQLAEQMAAGGVDKRYVAFAYGTPPQAEGEIDAPIGRVPEDPHRRAVRADGAPSRTEYRVDARYRCGASKLSLRLGTGRTHQIRVHLQWIGCPLIGDDDYATEAWAGSALADALAPVAGRQALHAASLSFRHPATGEALTLTAPLPDDLVRLEETLAELDVPPAGGG